MRTMLDSIRVLGCAAGNRGGEACVRGTDNRAAASSLPERRSELVVQGKEKECSDSYPRVVFIQLAIVIIARTTLAYSTRKVPAVARSTNPRSRLVIPTPCAVRHV